jgi:hypothetical protein
MPKIRIPKEHWGETWRALVTLGPISRLSEEPVYFVTERQLQVLRRKKLPFELLTPPNGRISDNIDA